MSIVYLNTDAYKNDNTAELQNYKINFFKYTGMKINYTDLSNLIKVQNGSIHSILD